MSERTLDPKLIAAGLAVAAGAYFVFSSIFGPDPGLLEDPPEEILGTWTTNDPRYEGRGFTVLEDEYRVQLAPDSGFAYRIEAIRRSQDGDTRTYEISYLTLDGTTTQAFDIDDEGRLRLKNPADVVWRRR